MVSSGTTADVRRCSQRQFAATYAASPAAKATAAVDERGVGGGGGGGNDELERGALPVELASALTRAAATSDAFGGLLLSS